jgi:2-polyprenyl-3-methyl-5-hydroxy-6-metoxy-1,4-benzoquinol methylase
MSTQATSSAIPAVTDPLTERVRAIWTDGDYGRIAASFESGAAAFVTRQGLSAGEYVLDVACGSGNVTLPAARTGANVTGVDIAPNLLAQLSDRAESEALVINLDEANCEDLPYTSDSFDTVISMFGAMFAARPEKAAAELLRVCKPGGRIIMANWTRDGFIGQMFKATSTFIAPNGLASPLLWGDEAVVADRLAGATVSTTRRLMCFDFALNAAGVVDLFRTYYGPTKRAFDGLDAQQRAALHRSLTLLWDEHNRSSDGATRVQSEYLEVTAIKA